MYGNEAAVGEGIRKATVPREELFVTTKINHRDLPAATLDEVREATEESLKRLGLNYVDLLYVHWPIGDYDPETTLPAMEELRAEGQIAHIGLSNCTPAMLNVALTALDAPLVAHQIEIRPLLQQDELREQGWQNDHTVVAYSPLSHGDVFGISDLQAVAAKHNISEAQVGLAWLFSKEHVAAVPKASSEAHLAAAKIDLDQEDITRIDAIDREERFIDPEGAPWNQ